MTKKMQPLIFITPKLTGKMVNISSIALVTVLTLGSLNSCDQRNEFDSEMSSSANYESIDSLDMADSEDMMLAEVNAVTNISGATEQALGSVVSDTKALGKALIITVNATFKVDDVVDSNKAIETLTRQQSGYVATSAISNHAIGSQTFTQDGQDITLITYRRQSDMTLRIPSEQVDDFLSQLQKQVKFLEYHEYQAKDVSLDIERKRLAASLENDMAGELGEERLNSDNADEQSSNVDSIVATYDAKRRAQYAELERLEIEDRIKYSTINLSFTEPLIVFKEVTANIDTMIDEYEPAFSSQVGHALASGWDDLKSAIVVIIRLWWLWLMLLVFIVMFTALKKAYRVAFHKNKK